MGYKKFTDPAAFIEPLIMNGLQGRMLYLPAQRSNAKEILFVYGQHTSLECWWGLAVNLNQYGTVTIPDLPGLGGMESFYKLGEQPSLDSLADYLAAFVKLRYRRRRLVIIGFGFGFAVITRMLQRYPQLERKVDLLVSLGGYAHKDDLPYGHVQRLLYRLGCTFLARRSPAWLVKTFGLKSVLLRLLYEHGHQTRGEFKKLRGGAAREAMKFDIYLWHINDLRTHLFSTAQLLALDNCQQQLTIPVWRIASELNRHPLDHIIEQHFRIIFSDVQQARSQVNFETVSFLHDSKAAHGLLPGPLRQALAQI